MLPAAQASPVVLTQEQVDNWNRDGFLIVPVFFPLSTIERANAEADEILVRHRDLIHPLNMRTRFLMNVFTQEKDLECFDPVIDLSLIFHELSVDKKLLALVGDLYGEPACFFKDKLIYKPPGLKGHELHQDIWHSIPDSFLSVLIPLDKSDRESGCTEVFPGHTQGQLSPPGQFLYPIPPGLVDETKGVFLELKPGDIAILHGFTPHRAAPNLSNRWRKVFFPSYNKFSEGGHQRPRYYVNFHARRREHFFKTSGGTDHYFV
ncbi:phytanoyl-CoA dioxygenase family protein [Zavarzinella formosa]|uniref:phytanoyl-CoA dioxygenase family protein n=1 Tax=Zavarzinella formosa TaxID=360055 RepID=UPI0002EF86A8|nr:phytanoyl-CoA dioxygenase family protein [Zavarzinella formosa]